MEYSLPSREQYDLGTATPRKDSFLNDLGGEGEGYLHASSASAPGWQCHISHLLHFYLGSSVENPLVKRHAVLKNIILAIKKRT